MVLPRCRQVQRVGDERIPVSVVATAPVRLAARTCVSASKARTRMGGSWRAALGQLRQRILRKRVAPPDALPSASRPVIAAITAYALMPSVASALSTSAMPCIAMRDASRAPTASKSSSQRASVALKRDAHVALRTDFQNAPARSGVDSGLTYACHVEHQLADGHARRGRRAVPQDRAQQADVARQRSAARSRSPRRCMR